MKPVPADSPAAADGPARPDGEKRLQADRRQTPTSPWGAFPPAGQRLRNRRAGEHRRPYFVDRFSPILLVFVLMLAIASIVDAVLTIRLLEAGGDEINPLMDRLLDYGILSFLLGKYVLTVSGLPLLLIFKNHYLFGTRLRIGYLLPLVVAMYLVLIGYQLVLMQKYAGWSLF
ncbi:MAG: DUF5658 family protein [Thermoguttaceae bacterium]|jgi:hypothetical protein